MMSILKVLPFALVASLAPSATLAQMQNYSVCPSAAYFGGPGAYCLPGPDGYNRVYHCNYPLGPAYLQDDCATRDVQCYHMPAGVPDRCADRRY